MGIASHAQEWWPLRRDQKVRVVLAAPTKTPIYSAEQIAKQYAVKAGAKSATIAFIASAIPTVMGAWAIPWARANLNYAAQAHIISLASGAAYFIVADKTILASARKNSFRSVGQLEEPSF